MYNGVLNIYKEKGYTSHDVVARLRGILHQKKIGHTGTLDPDAAGVLPVCLGQATRLADMLTDKTQTAPISGPCATTSDRNWDAAAAWKNCCGPRWSGFRWQTA